MTVVREEMDKEMMVVYISDDDDNSGPFHHTILPFCPANDIHKAKKVKIRFKSSLAQAQAQAQSQVK